MIKHVDILLKSYPRGFHIISNDVLKVIGDLPKDGLLHLFIKHTSAGLTVNENADPSVLEDYESIFNDLVPENLPYLKHTMEGPDDMPAHIKSSLVGSSISVPIVSGRLDFGTWQGIYLCEFRNQGGHRKLTATIIS